MANVGDSHAYYKKRLDKFRARSTRVFNRAQNLNRTLDKQLATAIKSLETTRDITIRRDQEKIWMVTGAGLRAPKYSTEKEDIPSYLGKQVHTTLPTPHELSSLLPNKKAKQRTQSAGNYTQLSRRRLSSMQSGDLNIYHYRKALENLRDKQHTTPLLYSEPIAESDGEEIAETHIDNEQTWATPTSFAPPVDSQIATKLRPTTAIPASTSKKPAERQDRPKTSIPSQARRKKRDTVPNAASLMIEQAQDPKNKILRTNFLEMYRRQLSKHQRRMSTLQESRKAMREASANEDQDLRPNAAVGMIPEGEEIEDERSRSAGFLGDTSSSVMRRSPLTIKQRLRRTSMAAVSGMNALHNEVKSLQSFRKFKQESLGILENDIPTIDDLEDGELFDEMRKCRYIRWGQDEEKIIELNEDQPLENQLKKLTIDTTKKPKRFLKKLREQNEPGESGAESRREKGKRTQGVDR